MRSHYWTIGKFADWVRGTPKLKCGTAEEWDEWQRKAQGESRLRYWLAEEGLDYLQKIVFWPTDKLYAAKYYINNRWVTKTHALTASPRDIPRGEWRDVGNRFLPCLFNELVDFVEVELAWWHIAWAEKDEKRKYNAPFWATGWFRWRTWRCPQAGLDNLDWQSKLRHTVNDGWEECDPNIGELTPQAKNALEVLALYKWWTEVYPNRPDPHDASGWSEYCELMRKEKGDGIRWIGVESSVPSTKALGRKALKLTHKIEAGYEKEDTEMMVRLIKVRNSLWT